MLTFHKEETDHENICQLVLDKYMNLLYESDKLLLKIEDELLMQNCIEDFSLILIDYHEQQDCYLDKILCKL